MEIRLIGSSAEIRVGINNLRQTFPGLVVHTVFKPGQGRLSVRAYLTARPERPSTIPAATDKKPRSKGPAPMINHIDLPSEVTR